MARLQRGRARAGAEMRRLDPRSAPSIRFNGAAPARARKYEAAQEWEVRLYPLQRGRARAGAEIRFCICGLHKKHWLQRGRARAGAEIG